MRGALLHSRTSIGRWRQWLCASPNNKLEHFLLVPRNKNTTIPYRPIPMVKPFSTKGQGCKDLIVETNAALCSPRNDPPTVRGTPHGASCLVQTMPTWLVKTRRAPSRHSRDARVCGHTTTATLKPSTPPPPPLPCNLDHDSCSVPGVALSSLILLQHLAC